MDNQNHFPYSFNGNACKTCGGKCCRGLGGYVWLSVEELEKMADKRKIDVGLFARQYVRRVQGRLSLQELVVNGEHFCCFFDRIDRHCTIYQCRPEQCRTFPFWEQFKKAPKALLAECLGVSLS